MRARNIAAVVSALLVLPWIATCGPGPRDNNPNCTSLCTALGFQQCNEDGSFEPPVACGDGEVCDPTIGCVACVPDSLYCHGPTANDVYRCNADGTGGELVEMCGPDETCSNGACKTPCEAALDHPSNVGCDFWAVDLDNEASNLASGNAAAQQFAVVVANNNEYPVTVTVTKNAARVGQPISEQVVTTVSIPPRVANRIDLPQREVDGAMGQNGTYTRNGGSGTFVSPHAYHVTTNGPVVVYQFNPIVQQFSNDASTLIPIQALGKDYIAVGFQTANPCGIDMLPVEGVPDHGAITIVGVEEDTTVTVTTSHAIMASGGDSGIAIPATPKGGTVTFKVGRYTVANLETAMFVGGVTGCASAVNGGQNGDFTGSYIKSDKPVVVFTASERGLGFGGAANVEYPPDWDMQNDDICCTDHLEEQLLPVTALGREFAVARSPIRSTYANWIEQDIIRVVGSADGTTVTTNLPAPNNTFTLNAREQKTFMARTGFTISADKAIQVAQYLVPQHFIKQGFTGDPSQLIIPAAEQHRKDYVFLVPTTFQKNYAVFAKPVTGANIKLDGTLLDSQEFGSCARAPIGMIAGVDYEQLPAERRAARTGPGYAPRSVYVLITGATGGIGLEIARGLVAAGAHVVIGCRDLARGAGVAAALASRAGGQVRVQALDLASLASVRALARWADGELPRLDVVINNAAVWSRQRRATADGLELAFGVNHVAHHALTVGVLPVLRRSPAARVITVSSGLHVRARMAWDDLMQARGGFNGVRAYEQSKLANLMFALALARRAGRGLTSNAVHPGLVRTQLTREYPEMFRQIHPRAIVSAAVAARATLRLALEPALATVSGRYFDREREEPPGKAAQSVADQDRLWQLTEELIAAAPRG